MRVLLTGATGFIGSQVARIMAREGCEVFALARERSDDWRIRDLGTRIEWLRCDLLAMRRVRGCVADVRPDTCLHLAWYAEPGKYLTSPLNFRLVTASLNLATALAKQGCRTFVGAGTCIEYDRRRGYLSESSPTRPESPYAASKLALWLLLEQLGRESGMRVAWARLFYPYGPYEDERRLVPSVIRTLLRGEPLPLTPGEQRRDFLHVEDVAAAVWRIAQSDVTGPVNVASAEAVRVRQVASALGRLLGRDELIRIGALPYRAGEPMALCARDNERLRSTGWAPRYDLQSGLRQTIDWWRARLAGA